MENGKYSGLSSLTFAHDAQRGISRRAYNLLIGGAVAWGFILNYAMMVLAAPSVYRTIVANPEGFKTLSIVFIVAYFALCFAGARLVSSDSLPKCVVGFHMVALPVGFLTALTAGTYAQALVERAFLLTAIIAVSMMILATLWPALFLSMGRALATSLLAALAVQLIGMFFFRQALEIADWMIVIIMSLYIGYDWARADALPPTATNAIAVATSLYLDLINLFLRLLSILSRSRRRD